MRRLPPLSVGHMLALPPLDTAFLAAYAVCACSLARARMYHTQHVYKDMTPVPRLMMPLLLHHGHTREVGFCSPRFP